MNAHALDHEREALRELIGRKAHWLERTLLVLAGLGTENDILSYRFKLDDLFRGFLGKYGDMRLLERARPPAYLHREIAKRLFEYLWNSKPKRFGEHFLLTDVIDAQINPDVHRSVGTCVGLTSLFSVLGLRGGLNLSLLVSSDHVMNRLTVGERTIDMDHTDPQGFDCRQARGFRELPLPTLAAHVLNNRGLTKERIGNRPAARSDYEKALRVQPEYANACNNRGNMKFSDGDLAGAIADYTEAIRLQPGFMEAYCNRGMARHRLGRLDEARDDYEMALSMSPEYGDARRCLQVLDDIEARHVGKRITIYVSP
jgi:tetratricopeptide (TPR) repeat protein